MDTLHDRAVTAASYLGAAISVVSGLTLTEWGILIGIVTALVTFVANLLYQHRKDKREQRLYELEVKRLCGLTPGGCDED